MLEQEYHAHSRRKYLMIASGIVLTFVAAYIFTTLGMKDAALLLVADTVGKLILYPVTIPVGIVISFLGVPLFIHLILRRRRSFE